MLAAMASNAQEDRIQARARRTELAGKEVWSNPESDGISHGGGLSSCPAVRVKQEDPISQRIKSLFGSVSPMSSLDSPSHQMPKQANPPSSGHQHSQSRSNSHSSAWQSGDKRHPSASSQPSDKPSEHKSDRKKGEHSKSDHKKKHKEKKKKSHSEEKSSKKSKSHSRERSPLKDVISKDPVNSKFISSNNHAEKRHRSPSVCSDKSDHSIHSKDKSKHHKPTSHTSQSQSNNSSRTHIKSANNPQNPADSSHPLPPQTPTVSTAPSSSNLNSSSKGAHVSKTEGHAEVTTDSQHSNSSTVSSSAKMPSSQPNNKDKNFSKPPALNLNGIIDKTKPTNPVQPTYKFDTDVTKILEQMTRSSVDTYVTEIQTPIKPISMPRFADLLKQIDPIAPIESKKQVKTTPNPSLTPAAPTKESSVKPADKVPQASKTPTAIISNGEANLGLEMSSDSESGSNSSSSSSSSSSDSSSSESDSDSSGSSDKTTDESPVKQIPIFTQTTFSPQDKPPQDTKNIWNLDNYIMENPTNLNNNTLPINKLPPASHPKAHSTPVTNSSSTPAANTVAGNTSNEKKAPRRGRPPKGNVKKETDPDFQPPHGAQPQIPAAIAERTKRPSATKSGQSKRGRPRKVDTVFKSEISDLSLSEDGSSSPSEPSSRGPVIPSKPIIGHLSADDDDDVNDVDDEDVDVDVVSNESPSTNVLVTQSEPISPIEVKPSTQNFDQGNSSESSLPISIPLAKLKRYPSMKKTHDSPTPKKTKLTKLIESKKNNPGNVKPPDEVQPTSFRHAGSKDISRSTLFAVPSYDNPQGFHEKARNLKKQGMTTENRPLRNLIILESVINFMMSGICRENNVKDVAGVKDYYMGTLTLAESLFNEGFRDHASVQDVSVFRCCQVLYYYVLAHLHVKIYKLLKDRTVTSCRRLEEHLKDSKSGTISPRNHPNLPTSGTQNRGRGSPSSPAPSPASITSTGSLESGRGAAATAQSQSVPDQVYKDLEHYMKSTKHLTAAYDMWQAGLMKATNEQRDFFQQLQDDVCAIDMHTDSKQLVHYVYSGCLRLQAKLSSGANNRAYT